MSLFFAVRGIVSDLRQVVDLTEIKNVDKEDKIISEGTEEGKSQDMPSFTASDLMLF